MPKHTPTPTENLTIHEYPWVTTDANWLLEYAKALEERIRHLENGLRKIARDGGHYGSALARKCLETEVLECSTDALAEEIEIPLDSPAAEGKIE